MNEATGGYAFLANRAYKYDYSIRRITDGPHEYVLDDQAMDPISGFYAASYRDIENDRSRTGSAQLDRLLHSPQLTEANHPDHAMFQQALQGVHGVDASTGRKPDRMSENLAGA